MKEEKKEPSWYIEIRSGHYILFSADTKKWNLEHNPNFYLDIPPDQVWEIVKLLIRRKIRNALRRMW